MPLLPMRLIPEYRDYVWGGDRLRPAIVPTAEAWVVYEGNRVSSGPYSDRTLADLALEFGPALLGKRTMLQTGNRFPLLIKILDCAQWLSLQVHPNDQQAVSLEGPGFFGKTEAWHILEAKPDSKLIAGIKPDVTGASLANSIREGTILDLVQTMDVQTGDTIFMSPGTIHALGPGLLIFEIQQTSDLTYRVYDWGRPQTETRKLHIDKAISVSRPDATVNIIPPPDQSKGNIAVLSQCKYFTLELVNSDQKILEFDTMNESFQTLTIIQGQAEVSTGKESFSMDHFETLLIPAECGKYTVSLTADCKILKART
jgi:mannose-6-phosphate isomerase